jgi:hypothetical protein
LAAGAACSTKSAGFEKRIGLILILAAGNQVDGFAVFGYFLAIVASWRKPDPELLPIQRPRCPKCQAWMRTARVSDGPKGFENRAFECAKCGHTETRAFASDPLNSDALGWLSGELGRPH